MSWVVGIAAPIDISTSAACNNHSGIQRIAINTYIGAAATTTARSVTLVSVATAIPAATDEATRR